MNTIVLSLFIVAWAAVAFGIVRALAIVWGAQRRLAIAAAAAVAGAFALGAVSPFALPSHSVSAPGAPAAALPAAPAAPGADTSHNVSCPPGATVAVAPGTGHLDGVGVDAGPAAAPPPLLNVSAGAPIRLEGWIVLDAGPPAAICAIVDGKVAAGAQTRYGIQRPDVAAALNKPADAASGFAVTLRLTHGEHVINVGAVESDGKSVYAIRNGALNVHVQ